MTSLLTEVTAEALAEALSEADRSAATAAVCWLVHQPGFGLVGAGCSADRLSAKVGV